MARCRHTPHWWHVHTNVHTNVHTTAEHTHTLSGRPHACQLMSPNPTPPHPTAPHPDHPRVRVRAPPHTGQLGPRGHLERVCGEREGQPDGAQARHAGRRRQAALRALAALQKCRRTHAAQCWGSCGAMGVARPAAGQTRVVMCTCAVLCCVVLGACQACCVLVHAAQQGQFLWAAEHSGAGGRDERLA